MARNVVKCMLSSMDDCRLTVTNSNSTSLSGVLEDINMRAQRQTDIHTTARSRPRNAKIALFSTFHYSRELFFPSRDVNKIDPEAEAREGCIAGSKVSMQSKQDAICRSSRIRWPVRLEEVVSIGPVEDLDAVAHGHVYNIVRVSLSLQSRRRSLSRVQCSSFEWHA